MSYFDSKEINHLADLIDQGQSYSWTSRKEEIFWTKAAEKILREHAAGQKSPLSEAALTSFSRRSGILRESLETHLVLHAGNRNLASLLEADDEMTKKFEKEPEKKGFFGSIAKGLGKGLAWIAKKLPGKTLKSRNWRILGGGGSKEDEKYRKAKEEALSAAYLPILKKEFDKIINNIDIQASGLDKKGMPNFAGDGTGVIFKEMIYSLVNFALMARSATGAGPTKSGASVEIKSDSPFKDAGITADDANALIRGVRKVLLGWDRELEDRWIYALEGRKNQNLPLLSEVILDEAPEAPENELGKAGQKASSQKSYSMKGPAVLAALGALGGVFGWLTTQSWFMQMFTEPARWSSILKAVKAVKTLGITQEIAFLIGRPGENISSMTVGEMKERMMEFGWLGDDGMPTERLIKMAEMCGNPDIVKWWAKNVAGRGSKVTLEQAIPLSGAGAPGAGGDIGVLETVGYEVKKTLIDAGGLSALGTLVAKAGAVAGPLGVGLLGGAAASALLRKYGKENSRASVIQAALDLLEDAEVDPSEVPETPPPSSEKPEGKPDGSKTSPTGDKPADAPPVPDLDGDMIALARYAFAKSLRDNVGFDPEKDVELNSAADEDLKQWKKVNPSASPEETQDALKAFRKKRGVKPAGDEAHKKEFIKVLNQVARDRAIAESMHRKLTLVEATALLNAGILLSDVLQEAGPKRLGLGDPDGSDKISTGPDGRMFRGQFSWVDKPEVIDKMWSHALNHFKKEGGSHDSTKEIGRAKEQLSRKKIFGGTGGKDASAEEKRFMMGASPEAQKALNKKMLEMLNKIVSSGVLYFKDKLSSKSIAMNLNNKDVATDSGKQFVMRAIVEYGKNLRTDPKAAWTLQYLRFQYSKLIDGAPTDEGKKAAVLSINPQGFELKPGSPMGAVASSLFGTEKMNFISADNKNWFGEVRKEGASAPTGARIPAANFMIGEATKRSNSGKILAESTVPAPVDPVLLKWQKLAGL